jgi:hypothetical protein
MTSPLRTTVAALLLALLAAQPSLADDAATPLGNEPLSVLMLVDQGRAYGYQTMMARIRLDTVEAELARDRAIRQQNEELYRKNAIALIDLEISQLKDAWNRKQLVVAEKSLDFVSAQYEAMRRMAEHFAGAEVSLETLYATFRRGWEAGCDKGPDEVVAMKAWVDYAATSLERARQLNAEGNAPDSVVLEREAELAIARSNHANRQAGLEKCRTVLFPGLDQIVAIGR